MHSLARRSHENEGTKDPLKPVLQRSVGLQMTFPGAKRVFHGWSSVMIQIHLAYSSCIAKMVVAATLQKGST